MKDLPPGFTVDKEQIPAGFTADQLPQDNTQDGILAKEITPEKQALIDEANKRGLFDYAMMVLEPAAAIASSAIATPVADIAGLAKTFTSGMDEGAETSRQIKEAFTYEPRTEPGQEALDTVQETGAPVTEAFTGFEKAIGDFTLDATGSETLAQLASLTPTIILEVLGLVGLKALKSGTKLIDDNGEPTKALQTQLRKEGLDYDTLKPETKELIPSEVGPRLLPGSKPIRQEAKQALIEEVRGGSRTDALAKFKLSPDGKNIRPDALANEAIKQGIRPGQVQSMKTASATTQSRMRDMLRIRKQIKGQESVALDKRPDIIIGDEIVDRLNFMRSKADSARTKLDDIAKNRLAGIPVDPTEVLTTVKKHVEDLGIDFVRDKNGKAKLNKRGAPTLDFEDSIISEDKSAQKSFRSLFRLMQKGGQPDALRMHNMKRELDSLIDFQKKDNSGLTESGRRALKDVRNSLNQTVRGVNPEYAEVNDVLHNVIRAVDDLDGSVGNIDILGEGSNRALGTKMRTLMSNTPGRINTDNALGELDNTVANLGGKFDANIKDLVFFDDLLNERFSAVARTSLAGQAEQAIENAITRGVGENIVNAVGKGAGKVVGKMRDIGDPQAFDAIDKILKRGINEQ